ncbi:hypothetical protein PR048_022492 [Dryococelus australis]|uniref:Uncharacterized protein n=1 Tax=Dryococelus australis TaxID=614101 RepID=A0ABQ9H184_9NEOP|nr:hypothetical protein PR048_022492 [Dryococelus australis]
MAPAVRQLCVLPMFLHELNSWVVAVNNLGHSSYQYQLRQDGSHEGNEDLGDTGMNRIRKVFGFICGESDHVVVHCKVPIKDRRKHRRYIFVGSLHHRGSDVEAMLDTAAYSCFTSREFISHLI